MAVGTVAGGQMTKQQATLVSDSTTALNQLLAEGWSVVSVTAQRVAAASDLAAYAPRGWFLVILERRPP